MMALPRGAIAAACGALVGAITLLWWPTLPHSFQFDDWNVIVEEARVQSLAAWWHSMPGIRPLLKLTYALNHEFGPNPAGFRAVNVLLHAANALLVFWLITQAASRLLPQVTQLTAAAAAFVTASLFALHPVQTQAVTYVSGRSSSLVGFACLVSLALFVWSRQRSAARAIQLAAIVAFLCALGVKESAIALPFVIVLWLVIIDGLDWRAAARKAAPFFWAAAGAVTILLLTTSYWRLIVLGGADKTLMGNLLTQANGLTYLIGQLLLVRSPNPDPALAYVSAPEWPVLLRGAAVFAILALGFWNVRRRPAIAFGVLWFFVWLAPTNSIAPRLDAVSDRQLYLALIGPAWLVAMGLLRLWRWQPVFGSAAAIAVVSVLTLATARHNRIYATEVGYWTYVTEQAPRNARAANNLGMAYAARCERDRALVAFEHAITLAPDDSLARVNRGLLLQGELVDACRKLDPGYRHRNAVPGNAPRQRSKRPRGSPKGFGSPKSAS